jgi:HTH-type transcriptional repressor of NAD biosynthesis genes
MKTYAHSVVIGKFYPPHRGHKHLIDTALSRSGRVSVIVVFTPGQAISGEMRAAWIREIHPCAEVLLVEQGELDDRDSPGWAKATIAWIGKPDAAFTSEAYGEPWSRAMGCDHVLVDMARARVPISGTKVRENPLAAWDFLEPPVRAHFARRVVVLGAESTGTTTLTRALAGRYGTVWAPEYGRMYAEGKYASPERVWRTDEFVHIAETQHACVERLARSADRVVFSDTDALATAVWHERYVGARASEVEAFAAAHRPDLYLLTGDEIPFEQDGLRDGEHLRHGMHARFEDVLAAQPVPYAILRGSHEERMREAGELVDALLEKEKIPT